ncbi:serine/threonine protein kinase [Streptomyces lividans TK24]|nr:serine/threonine protein kinase [Streptomyces lividans TK24]
MTAARSRCVRWGMMGRMVTEGAGGRVIAGRYRLHERLGRGGMGIVWRATDQLLAREVAVKALPLDESLSAAEARRRRERTLREARAVAQLRHPHVIVVHDVVEDDGRAYMVMELVDGGSLADRVLTRGPVDAVEAARIGVALLDALDTAHASGILHRDVKPSNVLVADDGRVVLTDFGVAQVAGATTLTESGSFVGSPEYTAPERMSGAGTGPESDLWSLGVLLCAVPQRRVPLPPRLAGRCPARRGHRGDPPTGAGRAAPPGRTGPAGARSAAAAGRGVGPADAARLPEHGPNARDTGGGHRRPAPACAAEREAERAPGGAAGRRGGGRGRVRGRAVRRRRRRRGRYADQFGARHADVDTADVDTADVDTDDGESRASGRVRFRQRHLNGR